MAVLRSIRALLLIFLVSLVNCLDFSSECEKWALPTVPKDYSSSKCVTNPKLMWSTCPKSCSKYAQDCHDVCSQWAKHGECMKNPYFMQVRCTKSCGAALAWNPVIREHMGIMMQLEDLEKPSSDNKCNNADDLLFISSIATTHFVRLVAGESDLLFSMDLSFTDSLYSMMGIADLALYSLRINHVISQRVKGCSSTGNIIHKTITQVVNTLQSFDEDKLVRSVLVWKDLLLLAQNLTETCVISRSIQTRLETTPLEPHGKCSGLNSDVIMRHYFPECREGEIYACDDRLLSSHGSSPFVDSSLDLPTMADEGRISLASSPPFSLPLLGVGVLHLSVAEVLSSVSTALSQGYRLIDIVDDHPDTDCAIKEALFGWIDNYGGRGEDVVVILHLMPERLISSTPSASHSTLLRYISKRRSRLGLDYIDIIVLEPEIPQFQQHRPPSFQQLDEKKEQAAIRSLWHEMERALQQGQVKALGVSNFDAFALGLLLSVGKVSRPLIAMIKADVYHMAPPDGWSVFDILQQYHILPVVQSVYSGYPSVMKPLFDLIVQRLAIWHDRLNITRPVSSPAKSPAIIGVQLEKDRFAQALPPGRSSEDILDPTLDLLNSHSLYNSDPYGDDGEVVADINGNINPSSNDAASYNHNHLQQQQQQPAMTSTASLLLRYHLSKGMAVVISSLSPLHLSELQVTLQQHLQGTNGLTIRESRVLDSLQHLLAVDGVHIPATPLPSDNNKYGYAHVDRAGKIRAGGVGQGGGDGYYDDEDDLFMAQ